MTEMVTRVAWAIACELEVLTEPGTTTTIGSLADRAASAAIEAMREPTGRLEKILYEYALRDEEPVAVLWEQLIDAALGKA